MIKISKILAFGGSCPTQLDAITSDGRMVYGRYRHGHLTVEIGAQYDFSEYAAVGGECILEKVVGEPWDGTMSKREFCEHTKDVLDFSGAKDILDT